MIKRISLAHLPTPVEKLPGLTRLLDGPQLLIKRDDLTGLGMGGNKTRKLEFLAADALEKGARMLISTGALKPCHRARLYCGTPAPSIDETATSRNGPIVRAGRMPTSTQASTRSMLGSSMPRVGSCGARGRFVASGPKNTWWMKRKE